MYKIDWRLICIYNKILMLIRLDYFRPWNPRLETLFDLDTVDINVYSNGTQVLGILQNANQWSLNLYHQWLCQSCWYENLFVAMRFASSTILSFNHSFSSCKNHKRYFLIYSDNLLRYWTWFNKLATYVQIRWVIFTSSKI